MNTDPQLEFPEITRHFPNAAIRILRRHTMHRRLPDQEASDRPDPLKLSAALTAENLGFLSFAMIVALHRHIKAMSIAEIAKAVGHSYWAVRSQIVNTHFFAFDASCKLKSATLSDDGRTKLLRIEKRLSST
jgi:hypothetical protein